MQHAIQAPNRTPVETWDYYAARYFVCLLVRYIMRQDGVSTKPKWAWHTFVFVSMKRFLPQLMYQTEFPALFKLVRLGIRAVEKGAGGFTYPGLRENEAWLQTVSVDFNPLPTRIYQSQWVSGKAGQDFLPRFTPEHCYQCRIVMKGGRLKEFLVNPQLVTEHRPLKRACVLANYPRKRPRQLEKGVDNIHEVYVTIDSNSLKPPLLPDFPYLLDQISVDPELLQGFPCLRLDHRKLEPEERPEYLEYVRALQEPSSQACDMVLAFTRELNLETIESEWPAGLTFRDFFCELSASLKHKLCTAVLAECPVCELQNPHLYESDNALLIHTDDALLKLYTLYIVEMRGTQESQVLCGVTQLQDASKPVLALSRRHFTESLQVSWLTCWEVTSLLAPIQELSTLLK